LNKNTLEMLFRGVFELSIKTPKGKSFQLVNLPIFAAAKIRDVLNGLNLKTVLPLSS
jgi:hypothetical protein